MHNPYLLHLGGSRFWCSAGVRSSTTQKPGNQLWGIYYTDREYAREHGDPLRTFIEARTKFAAEEEAARLGFGDP